MVGAGLATSQLRPGPMGSVPLRCFLEFRGKGPLNTPKGAPGPFPIVFLPKDSQKAVVLYDIREFTSSFCKVQGIWFVQRAPLNLSLAVGAVFEAEGKEIMAGNPECPAVTLPLTRASPKLWGHRLLSSQLHRGLPDSLFPDTHLCGRPTVPSGVLPGPD